jgi:FkbM family methyltransferase
MYNPIKKFYYLVLDTILLGKGLKRHVSGFPIKFPARFYKYYEKDYELESFHFIRSQVKPGDVVLDIGGHIGLYSVAFGQLVGASGKVYSFEPTPTTNSVLKKTIRLNKMEHIVSVHNDAISKTKGETLFYISEDEADNSNSLIKFRSTEEVHGVRINLISIDEFSKSIGTKINFIKIDVEGAEYDVLLGAKETMFRDRPVCILGLHPNQIKLKNDSLYAIWDVIKNYAYAVYLDGKRISEEQFCSQTSLFDVHLIPE